MKNNKKDLIIMTVGMVMLALVSVGLLVSLFSPFGSTVGESSDTTGGYVVEELYDVDIVMLGASKTETSYQLAPNDTLTLKVTADAGYVLPDTVTVSGASHTWTKSSCSVATLVVQNVTKDVDVIISAFNEISLYFGLDDQSDHNNNYIDGPTTLILELNKPVTFELGLNLNDCDFRFDVDEGITVTYTEPSDSGVMNVTVTWNGEIPDDGHFDFVTVYLEAGTVNTLSLELENCSVEEVVS